MGCDASRDSHPEDIIEANELELGFCNMTVAQIKEVSDHQPFSLPLYKFQK